ncbi:HlyD family type I secretion periplasmic adaptor subunit [Herbaspirillum sp. RV1423]|uniref:HlyD family type I secretion periplasmic adaptor subunit n=1 Tax=Herbaspirillum sp. RV1423 TaxID=1443993 RepID=UPI0004AFAFA9|nr:HlyD family type I secretion periplasmic adaptor subunit [Herbaspirillum sp. RV1423]
MPTSSGKNQGQPDSNTSENRIDAVSSQSGPRQAGAKIIPLRPGHRWDDPLRLIEDAAPGETGRLVLWTVCILIFLMILWASFGKLDIIASAEGKLTPQTLLKIVQPAESGVVQQLLVNEGDSVKAGQVLARLDTTLARADSAGIANDLAHQTMQERRIEAELSGQPMLPVAGDNPVLFAQVLGQYRAHRQAYLDSLEQERALLSKAEHERRSALQILAKLEQTLPSYERSAEAYTKLEQEGFFSPLATAEKRREATEKARDLDAQHSAVSAIDATIEAQGKRISQIQSAYRSELEKERAEIRARIAQLQPGLEKTAYREGLMELKAPQDGTIKDLATTTLGAVVQPGSVVMSLVPRDELLFADVNIKNEDVGFVLIGQKAQIKLATYPFQKYGMLSGVVTHIGADASENNRQSQIDPTKNGNESANVAAWTYKARIRLDRQTLRDPQGALLPLTPGMQVVAEIQQGKRTVLEYLLSPVQKAVQEAGRER